ncbi:carbohydrate binding-domain-containing protein [Mycena polygramma]|nr:carbohydrate binding-domain-containing protein [Mycena polygramma]
MLPGIIPLGLITLAASLVAAEDLATCGASKYYPSQYTCFDDDFLCPIENGDRFIRCGDACSNTTLEPISHSAPEPLEACGDSLFYPSQYVCLDGNFLCPFMNGAATLRCGDACYSPYLYTCTNGELAPVPCVPEYGQDEVCNAQGCFVLPCCPGLISVATKCRDRCQLAPNSCPH